MLLIDLDTRGPLADDLSVAVPEGLPPLAEALKRGQFDDAVIATPIPNLCLIPGDLSLDEQSLANEPLRDAVLQRALQKLQQPFSFVLLDTPPGLNLITLNAIMAAEKLVIPCDSDRESLEAAKRTIEAALQYLQFRPEINAETFYRVLVSMVDHRDRVVNDWFETQLQHLRLPAFKTRIRRSTGIKKARAHGLSIFDYSERQRSKHRDAGAGAADFASFADELLAYAC